MSVEENFDQFDKFIQDTFINILEEAKIKFLKNQEYEMAAKMRDLVTYERMEEGEEKKQYMQKLIKFYNIK